jgi:hypothetical protein
MQHTAVQCADTWSNWSLAHHALMQAGTATQKPVAVTEQANNVVDLPVDQLLCKVDCEMR